MTADMTENWLSPSDTMLWRIERDPLLRSTITSVWLLPGLPDRERCDAAVERMVNSVARLRQRVVDEHPNVGAPRWEHDPLFDMGFHYRWSRLAGQRPGRDELLRHAEHLAKRSFDRDRPLWELDVVTGLAGGNAGLVFKVHHAIADGLGLVLVLQHVVGLTSDDDAIIDAPVTAAPPTEQPATPDLVNGWTRALSHRLTSDAETARRAGRSALRTAGDMLRDPVGTVSNLSKTTSSAAGLVKPATTPLSPLMVDRSMRVRFETVAVELDRLKTAAKSIDGGTLNDAFITAVLGGLDHYHRAMGVEASAVRLHMPISIRAVGERTEQVDNQFAPARVEVSLVAEDTLSRMQQVHEHLRSVREEPALPHLNDISDAIGRLGPDISVSVIGAMMKGVDVTASNVPGPPFPVYFAGEQIKEFIAFGPLAGSAMNITLFSYDGTLHMGVAIDQAAVAEPATLISCLERGVADVLALVN